MSKRKKPWAAARWDRIYLDASGVTHILDGLSGHGGGGMSFHPGSRLGCPLCRDGHNHPDMPCHERGCVRLRFPDPRTPR